MYIIRSFLGIFRFSVAETENYRPDFSSENVTHINKSVAAQK
jgi:hypothetical protein